MTKNVQNNVLSPTAEAILERWNKQPHSLRTMSAAELMSCTESDLNLMKLIMELKRKPFVPRCPGAGISFCPSNERRKIMKYIQGEESE